LTIGSIKIALGALRFWPLASSLVQRGRPLLFR
jgi:hypothetical protein